MSRNQAEQGGAFSLNDSQLIKAVSKVANIANLNLDQRTDLVFNPELKIIADGWKSNAAYIESLGEGSVNKLIGAFISGFSRDANRVGKFFSQDKLKSDGDFADYVKKFAPINFVQCGQLAALFFDCLCYIETKAEDERERYFLEFPPIVEDLKCLDGTFERINQTYLKLIVDTKYQPLLSVHEEVMLGMVDRLKDYVYQGNHVHIFDYLAKTLDFIDQAPLHAESQIPVFKLWEIYCDYADDFRAVLSGQSALRRVEKKFPGIDLAKFGIRDEGVMKEISYGLRHFEDVLGEGLFNIGDDDSWVGVNFEFLRKAAEQMPAVSILRDLSNSPDVLSLADITSDENDLLGKLKDPSKIHPNATIFSEGFVENLISVLTRGNEGLGNKQDLLFGIKALSIISNHNLIGSSFNISSRIIGAIMRLQLKPEIAEVVDKAAASNRVFLDKMGSRLLESKTEEALFLGKTTEELIRAISTDDNLSDFVSAHEDSGLENLIRFSKQLVRRPDADQIFNALKNGLGRDSLEGGCDLVDRCFIEAFSSNNVNLCRQISDDFFVSENLSRNYGLISRATRSRWVEMAKFLTNFALENNATEEFLCFGDGFLTPGGEAARTGNREILEFFYSSGIDRAMINQQSGDGNNTPLDLAVISGNTNVVKFFFESELCERPDENSVMKAIGGATYFGQGHILRYLHDDIRIEERFFIEAPQYEHSREYSAIELATIGNHPKIIEQLISYGANFREVGIQGNSLLHLATTSGSCDAIKFLCDQGLDPNCVNENGETPLHKAVELNQLSAIEALGRFGANPLQKNNHGVHPIKLAAITRNDSALISLLAIPDPNTGNIFLHDAVNDESKRAFLGKLIEIGFHLGNLNPKNFNEETPLFLALMKQDLDSVLILKGLGVNLNCEDENGHTTIYHLLKAMGSADSNSKQEAEVAIELLLSCGADINHSNRDGKTVFDLLMENPLVNTDGIRLLSEYYKHLDLISRDKLDAMFGGLGGEAEQRFGSQVFSDEEAKSGQDVFLNEEEESEMKGEERASPPGRISPDSDESRALNGKNPKEKDR